MMRGVKTEPAEMVSYLFVITFFFLSLIVLGCVAVY